MARESLKPINIRDPLYGFIKLNELERKIIQTWSFQRLRHIRQLGTTTWVYPSGNHTRFEHSLGVFHLSKMILNNLKTFNLEEKDKEIFYLASLLHDIGHAPFSHAGESLFNKSTKHEEIGAKIVRNTEIKDILTEQFDKKIINRILYIMEATDLGGSPVDQLLRDLLTGQAGIDRMDYLLRDSRTLGVKYGEFDLERILETICYREEERTDAKEGSTLIYWKEGGMRALEHFVLARYYMYTEVYFHKTTRILNFHLTQAIKEYLISKFNVSTYPTKVDEYLGVTDLEILSWIRKSKFKPIFYERKFFKLIPGIGEIHQKDDDIKIWQNLEKELQKEYKDKFYIDKVERGTYNFTGGKDIRVERRKKIKLLHEITDVIKSLNPIITRRLYADKHIINEIEKKAKKFINMSKIKKK